jgi:cysteine synthase
VKEDSPPLHITHADPALNMLTKEVHPEKSKTVVEYSSGSTVISLALVSRINHGIQDVRAFLSNKTSAPKLRLMQFFGLDMYVGLLLTVDDF